MANPIVTAACACAHCATAQMIVHTLQHLTNKAAHQKSLQNRAWLLVLALSTPIHKHKSLSEQRKQGGGCWSTDQQQGLAPHPKKGADIHDWAEEMPK